MAENRIVYVTIIEASREKVWGALTRTEFTSLYWHNTHVQSSWRIADPVEFLVYPEGGDASEIGCEGEVLACDPPAKLSYTWRFPRVSELCDEPPSRVTFHLEALAEGVTKLTLIHDEFPEGSGMFPMVDEGWPFVLSGLKTLLETGREVDFSTLMND